MRAPSKFRWTAEEFIAKLAQVYPTLQDPSTTAIASRLAVSRGVVSGFYTRVPELRTRFPLAGGERARIVKPVMVRRAYTRRSREGTKERVKPVPALKAPDKGLYTLLTLPAACCKWPAEGSGADTLFCGDARQAGKPYCKSHTTRAGRLYA